MEQGIKKSQSRLKDLALNLNVWEARLEKMVEEMCASGNVDQEHLRHVMDTVLLAQRAFCQESAKH